MQESGMPGSGTSTFIDSDDYQASLSHLRIDLLVTFQGAFNARLTWATLHHLQLLHSEEDMPRIAHVSLAPTLVFVGFVTRPDPPMLWGGVELQTGDLIFHSPGERFHQRTTGPCSWSLVGFVPKHLERYCEALSGKALSLPAAARILCPAARDAARLRRLHAQACRLAETRPKVLAHPEVARAIEQGLIHALVPCLVAKTRDDGAARRHHTRIMARFEEVLADHPNRQLHLPELCALIGVSERTLRSCCTEFLGISPSRYVLLRRLQAARIALRDADPATASVAEIAGGCGFTELGRFAGAYRNAFGEAPLTTLRRPPVPGILGSTSAKSA
jgi:AraC-like DNA-binding protein